MAEHAAPARMATEKNDGWTIEVTWIDKEDPAESECVIWGISVKFLEYLHPGNIETFVQSDDRKTANCKITLSHPQQLQMRKILQFNFLLRVVFVARLPGLNRLIATLSGMNGYRDNYFRVSYSIHTSEHSNDNTSTLGVHTDWVPYSSTKKLIFGPLVDVQSYCSSKNDTACVCKIETKNYIHARNMLLVRKKNKKKRI